VDLEGYDPKILTLHFHFKVLIQAYRHGLQIVRSAQGGTPSLARTGIDPYRIDSKVLLQWCSDCKMMHLDTCWPTRPMLKAKRNSPDIGSTKLRVIDVSSDRIIPAPGHCEYVGLSYV
jgi:hypothetical protein